LASGGFGSKVRGPRQMDSSDGSPPTGGGGKFDVQTVSSSLSTTLADFFLLRWRSSLATNSLGMMYSLVNRGSGSWRAVSLQKNGASITTNVAANALYVLEEEAVWKIGMLVEA
jgi:hypothetical protein